jgi:DNA-binding GntR family transcriptional regulator
MTVTPQTKSPSRAAAQPSASARVVREIVRGLYEGDYVPGQRLAEPELMQQFGVSRSTVRESIRRMESEGIVDVLPHRGAVIRRLTVEEAIDALLVMEICVGLAARQAAERIDTPGSRERFDGAWRELLEFRNRGDGYDFVKARNKFYRTITRISCNRELQRIVPTIHVHLLRREYSLSPETRFEDYARIADAILAGKGSIAEAAARGHIAKTALLVRQRARPT